MTNRKPVLTLMTIATQLDRHAPMFLESCRRFGYEPIILGEGRRWTGFGLKLALLRRALRELPETRGRIVLYADSHDSLILAPASEILKQFARMDHPLVFSAEKNCYPDAWRALIYPSASTPWKYLNAGGFVGEATLIREHLENIRGTIPPRLHDQRWWTLRFLRDPPAIRLDTRCQIFQTLFMSDGDLEYRDRLYNHVTRTHPSIVHGNGWSDMSQVIKWFRRARKGRGRRA